MHVRSAHPDDLPHIVRLRMALFEEAEGELAPAAHAATREATEQFFRKHLDSEQAKSWIAEADGQVAAIGTMAFFVRPPYPGNLDGKEAYLLNMYTAPQFRKLGMASAILKVALEHAGHIGCKKLWLHASPAGEPLYTKAGFLHSSSYMELDRP